MGRTLQLYKKLFEQLKTGSSHQIYFLHGPEEFMKKEFIGELIETRLSGENRAFNLDIFHGDDFDRDSFNERISSFPLFNERRMVILKKTEALTTANKDLFSSTSPVSRIPSYSWRKRPRTGSTPPG